MDEEYDCIVLGTGLKECILSGLLSVEGKKVLHLDVNGYYGAASASLNLRQLFEKYRTPQPTAAAAATGDATTTTTAAAATPAAPEPPASLGSNKEYNVDIVPKFIMSTGLLVQMLLHTDVTRYIKFKSIAGSYVYRSGKIHKVPATDNEAIRSPLMGLLEKRRCAKFLQYIQGYDPSNPKTHNGLDLSKVTSGELLKKYSLEPDTVDFIGHATALYLDDAYLTQPAIEMVDRCKLYFDSLSRYSRSPYLYPLYGLGELPQGFARLSAIYGGTYMLNAPIERVVFDETTGAVVGVQSNEEAAGRPLAKCKFIVADPSYFPDRVKKTGQVIRIICILSHPVAGLEDPESAQIIIPQKQVGRKSDIYVCVMSSGNDVAPAGKWIAIAATTVETANPVAELKPGLALLGQIDEQFVSITDILEPTSDGTKDRVFISKSYDATTHFETTVEDVMDMYERITGNKLVLKPKNQGGEDGGDAAATST